MVRILLILGGIFITVGFIIWRFMFSSSETPILTLPQNFSVSKSGEQTATVSGTLENRVKELEFAVAELLRKTPGTTASITTTGSLDSKVKTLENSINELSSRVAKLETGTSTTTTTTSTGAKVAYIPVGYTGSGNATSDYTNVSGQEVTIDTANYPGYKSMTLEANFRIYQGNGTGYIRLANKTDGTSFSSSILSTTSEDYATKTSSSFTISSGSKTYVIQAKSTTGYSVDLQWSRIRVDF
jgi:hypothetical protein